MPKSKKVEVQGPRSIYLGATYTEIAAEAARLGRSVSWLIRSAWQIARATIKKMDPPPKGVALK